MVQIKLHTILKNYCPAAGGCLQMPCGEGLTVEKMLANLDLRPGLVGLVLVNGKIAQNDCMLAEGDEVELYPVFGGG